MRARSNERLPLNGTASEGRVKNKNLRRWLTGIWSFALATVVLYFVCLLLARTHSALQSTSVKPTEFSQFRVLVTGFRPFDGFAENPAELVAGRLNGTCFTPTGESTRVCWDGVALDVSTEGARSVARYLSKCGKVASEGKLDHDTADMTNLLPEKTELDSWPCKNFDAIIHLGLEDSAKGLKVETMAMNVAANKIVSWNRDIPCNKSNTNFEDAVTGGPCMLPTTIDLSTMGFPVLPADAALETTRTADLFRREMWSRDAGAYYCNEIYYRTLHTVRMLGQGSRNDGRARLLPVVFVHLPDPADLPVELAASMVQLLGAEIARN